MTVGKKIFLIMLALVFLFLGAAFIILQNILQQASNQEDLRRARTNLSRVVQAFENELEALDRTNHHLSAWDASYAFIQKPSEAFVRSNLADSDFSDNNFDLIAFLDKNDSIVLARAFDFEARRQSPVPPDFEARVRPGKLLLDHPDLSSRRLGYIALGPAVYRVSSRPILTSQGEGPRRGTLIIARSLDASEVQKIAKQTNMAVRILPPSDAAVPEDVRAGFAAGVPEGPPVFRTTAGEISAFRLFRDIDGLPAFVVAVDLARLIRAQSGRSQRIFLLALIVFAIISLVVAQVVIQKMITSRLGQLTGFVKSYEGAGHLPRRIEVSGRDEVADLAGTLNNLLETQNRQSEKARRDEALIKKSEMKYHSLFEASTDAIFLETFDGRILDCNQAACDLLGYPKEELVKLTAQDLVPEEVQAQLLGMIDTLRENGGFIVESMSQKRTGEIVPVEVNARLARIGDETLVVVYLHNLSRRKHDEKVQTAVYRISGAASSARSLRELFTLIHETVVELIPAKNFYIALYDEESQLMSFPYFIDEHDAAPPPRRLRRGLSEYVLRTGEPLLATLPEIEDLRNRGEVEILGSPSFDWLGVPLRHDEKTIGVMAAQNYLPGPRFGEEEKNIMIFVSSQAAMAIDRVRSQELLRASIKEKEVLIREVHHRVKNNMQLISSIFNLQAHELQDARALTLIKECQARIRSMALVHEKLYQARDLARINFSDYIHSLAIHLFHFWQVNPERIRLVLAVKPVFLDINTAIPCGLILNELISNALEHAFPKSGPGEIRIRLEPAGEDRTILEIGDSGRGLPESVNLDKVDTLGLQIVTLLVQQLDGTISLSREGGTLYTINFRELKLKTQA